MCALLYTPAQKSEQFHDAVVERESIGVGNIMGSLSLPVTNYEFHLIMQCFHIII